MYKGEILTIVKDWSVEQLTAYIDQLNERVKDTNILIRELRILRKRKTGRKILDTGARDGR